VPDRRANADGRGGRTERRSPGTLALALGLIGATAGFTATFRGPRDRFWSRMTYTGLALGSFGLLVSPLSRRALRVRPWHVIAGLASAGVLYVTFQVGDRFARRFVPGGDRQIREIYALRELRPRAEITARLASIVGPAEEIFWRGLVQESLMARYGRWRGAVLASLAYSGVHVTTGNFTLLGAAGVAGAHWCALYALGVPLGVLVVSHVAWDVWIFLVQPTGETTLLGSGAAVFA
jgi:uncharacterized protein